MSPPWSAPLATGNNPIALTTDSSGKFVYVVNRDDVTSANNTTGAYAAIVVVIICSVLLTELLSWLEGRMSHWVR